MTRFTSATRLFTTAKTTSASSIVSRQAAQLLACSHVPCVLRSCQDKSPAHFNTIPPPKNVFCAACEPVADMLSRNMSIGHDPRRLRAPRHIRHAAAEVPTLQLTLLRNVITPFSVPVKLSPSHWQATIEYQEKHGTHQDDPSWCVNCDVVIIQPFFV